MTLYQQELQKHYRHIFHGPHGERKWLKGPFHELPKEFKILEFPPNSSRDTWVYATSGLSLPSGYNSAIELHIFSKVSDFSIVELLTIIAHYHISEHHLKLGDSVFFGKSWQDTSNCTYGYISLPYLYGPDLEEFQIGNEIVKCYWLIPITAEEVEYKKQFGIDALEEKFEESDFNYLDPKRQSVV